MWRKDKIESKWPIARMRGPNVTKEQALDYIWKTDYCLQGIGSTNDEEFNNELEDWLGCRRYNREIGKWLPSYEEWQATVKSRGQFWLHHFGSEWVGTTFASGVHGPVHPNGEVNLAITFGKWPIFEEIEMDLSKLAAEFPWLAFELGLWDDPDLSLILENRPLEGPPDFGWRLDRGAWQRVHVEKMFKHCPLPIPFGHESKHSRIEYTWPVSYLKEMWGDRV